MPKLELIAPLDLARLRYLLWAVEKHATISGLPWRVKPSRGYPLLMMGSEGRGAMAAEGTIGSWNEIELAALSVSLLPTLLAAYDAVTPPETEAEREEQVEALARQMAVDKVGLRPDLAHTLPDDVWRAMADQASEWVPPVGGLSCAARGKLVELQARIRETRRRLDEIAAATRSRPASE